MPSHPRSILNQIIASTSLALTSCTAFAADPAPRVLREPVFGLHYELSQLRFDPLPRQALTNCETLADDNPSLRSVWFLYGQTRDASGRTYYVAGGYDIRLNEQERHKKFETEDLGIIFFTEPGKCITLDSARQVFDDRLLDDDLPQPILKQLATDVVRRLGKALGGPARLRMELRNQHIDVTSLPPELHDAMKSYLDR